jgi:hypothetical protein
VRQQNAARVNAILVRYGTMKRCWQNRSSPHWRVGFLFLVLYPLLPSRPSSLTLSYTLSLTHSLGITHSPTHTTLTHSLSDHITHTHTPHSLTHSHITSLTHTCSERSLRILMWNASYVHKTVQ